MSQKKLNNCVNRIFNEIREDGISILSHEVRAALTRLVETTPLKDQQNDDRLAWRFGTPHEQVTWLLKCCDITADEIRTCIFKAAQPLPGDIAITDDILELLNQMVQNMVSTKILNSFADISGTTFQWANEITMVQSIDRIVDQCTKDLIRTCTDEINCKGPHYQFSWLTENGYSEEEIVANLQDQDHDTSLSPQPD